MVLFKKDFPYDDIKNGLITIQSAGIRFFFSPNYKKSI